MHIIARTIKQSLSQTSIPLVLTPLARQRRNTLWVTSRISCRESQSGAKATKKQHMVVATGNLSSRHSHESHWAPNCKWLSAKLEVLSGRITKPKRPQLHLNVSRLTSVCNRLCLSHGGVGTKGIDSQRSPTQIAHKRRTGKLDMQYEVEQVIQEYTTLSQR